MKKIFISFFVLTMAAAVFLWKDRNAKIKKLDILSEQIEDKKQIIALLSGNMKMHYVYAEHSLCDMILINQNGERIRLSEQLQHTPKLVFKISNSNCSSCLRFILSSLDKMMKRIPKDQLLLIADNSNIREIKAVMNSWNVKCPVYRVEENAFSQILKEENVPFNFIIDADLQMKDLFIPMKELPEYSDMYYRIIWKKYFDK